MVKLMARIAKAALKLTLAFVLVVAGFMGFIRYKQYPMETFCDSVMPGETPDAVMARAAELGYPAFNAIEARGVVAVLNQKAPYFRFSCEVEFQPSGAIATRVRAAD
jgi:hypothetical protein